MKFLVVSSPHAYTTRDVWQRVAKGLRLNGAEVETFDLLPRWQLFEKLFELAQDAKVPLPETVYANLLAYEPVFGAAHWHDCDTVIIVSPQYCPLPLIEVLRKSGKKTVAYFTECPYEDPSIAPIQASAFDMCFVNDKYSVDLFRSFNENTFYLPHTFDVDIHHPGPRGEQNNVVFVGTLYPSREEVFRSVNWTGIDFDIYGIHWLRKNSRLKGFIRGKVIDNEEAADVYRRSAVGLSMHRQERFGKGGSQFLIDEGEAYSAGPRTWELAACGTFQVSDERPEITDLFGDSVPVYRSAKELERILRKALDEPGWRNELAEQQRLAVQGRDCRYTMRTMLEHVA